MDGKMHPELTNHVVPPKGLAFLNSTDKSPKENCAASRKKENKNPRQALFNLIKAFFGGLATFLTIIGGWPIIKRIIAFFVSLFD